MDPVNLESRASVSPQKRARKKETLLLVTNTSDQARNQKEKTYDWLWILIGRSVALLVGGARADKPTTNTRNERTRCHILEQQQLQQ